MNFFCEESSPCWFAILIDRCDTFFNCFRSAYNNCRGVRVWTLQDFQVSKDLEFSSWTWCGSERGKNARTDLQVPLYYFLRDFQFLWLFPLVWFSGLSFCHCPQKLQIMFYQPTSCNINRIIVHGLFRDFFVLELANISADDGRHLQPGLQNAQTIWLLIGPNFGGKESFGWRYGCISISPSCATNKR